LGALEGQKMELVEGELINKMGKKRPHSNSLELLQRMLLGVFGRRLNRETPIDVAPDDNPTNEPEPDLIVLKRDLSEFQENPRPGDVDLVVEIADTTLGFDRGIKARLYARAGIADYWVLDVNGRRMIVHRDPRDGQYQSVIAYGIDESVSPLAAPGAAFRVRDAFTG